MTTTQEHTKTMQEILRKSAGKRNKKLEVAENKCSAHIARSIRLSRKEFKRQIKTGERSTRYWTGAKS